MIPVTERVEQYHRPAQGLRHRPVAKGRRGVAEVRRLRGGSGGRTCDHGTVPALEGTVQLCQPAELGRLAQPCAHLCPLAARVGTGNGSAALQIDSGKPETAATLHLHRPGNRLDRRRGFTAGFETRSARPYPLHPVRSVVRDGPSDR